MFTLSAFADEISPDPAEQIAVLRACRVRFLEFRSIDRINVLKLADARLREFRTMLSDAGIGLSAIGSPVGKIAINAPFEPHLELFERAIEVAQMFGTPNIRIFSYYPPADSTGSVDWAPYREEVLRRMRVKAQRAEKAGVVLLHENEHRIYGDSPERVQDIFKSVKSPALRAAYDAANWIFCGYDPVEGWNRTKEFTSHFHIKDWKIPRDGEGHGHGVIPGTGDGQIAVSIREAVSRDYRGFATMEPHLRGGGPTGGVTGPDLFPYAVEAFRKILHDCGATEG